MFLARMAWAGTIDQLTTAWISGLARNLATLAVRSVALLSYTSSATMVMPKSAAFLASCSLPALPKPSLAASTAILLMPRFCMRV